jgi:hypothetical protein
MKVYKISDLLNVNYEAYYKVITYLRHSVGQSSSNEALCKYADQAGYVATFDGVLYKEV